MFCMQQVRPNFLLSAVLKLIAASFMKSFFACSHAECCSIETLQRKTARFFPYTDLFGYFNLYHSFKLNCSMPYLIAPSVPYSASRIE